MDQYPNIIYKRLDYDPGIYDTWNAAIQLCRGEFLTNANLDDRKAPHSIEKHADALATIEKADLGYCNFLHFKCAGNRSCSAWVTGGALDDKDRTQ